MVAKLLGVTDAEEVAQQARVEEIELGCLDEALAQVAVVRTKPEDKVAGFQDGQPGTCGVVSDSAVGLIVN